MTTGLNPEILRGGTAVITGAASGFGREFAISCARLGMRLCLTDVNIPGLEETAALTGLPQSALLLQRCDVSNADEVEALAQATYDRFGDVRLLFNNAGVLAAGPLWKATPEDWSWVLGVNLMGVAYGIRSFVPRMLEQGCEAWIVNTASAAGLMCPPELGVYAASKHAVVAVSECLHHEIAATGVPIGVSVLCPAYVNTGIADGGKQRPQALQATNPHNEAFVERTRDAMKAGRLNAADVARLTFEAVFSGRFYVLTHRNVTAGVTQRLNAFLNDMAPDNPLRRS